MNYANPFLIQSQYPCSFMFARGRNGVDDSFTARSRDADAEWLDAAPLIKKYLEVNSGFDRGRIYRIKHESMEASEPIWPGGLDAAGLVERLDHPNGWHRTTAARLLYERQDASVAGRLLFGTDYLAPGQAIPQFELFESLDLPANVKKQIYAENAKRLLGMK